MCEKLRVSCRDLMPGGLDPCRAPACRHLALTARTIEIFYNNSSRPYNTRNSKPGGRVLTCGAGVCTILDTMAILDTMGSSTNNPTNNRKNYRIVRSTDADIVERLVSAYRLKGWGLHGGLNVYSGKNSGEPWVEFAQVVTHGNEAVVEGSDDIRRALEQAQESLCRHLCMQHDELPMSHHPDCTDAREALRKAKV